MNSIRDELLSFDTNEFIFALRREADHPACETFLFDKLNELQIYIPLQVLIELQRNLRDQEMRRVLLALTKAKSVTWDYAPASIEREGQWEQRGAKKGRRCDCRSPRSRRRSPSFLRTVISWPNYPTCHSRC